MDDENMVTVIIINTLHLTCAMYLVLSLYFTQFSHLIHAIFLEVGYDYPYFIWKETGANKDYVNHLKQYNVDDIMLMKQYNVRRGSLILKTKNIRSTKLMLLYSPKGKLEATGRH